VMRRLYARVLFEAVRRKARVIMFDSAFTSLEFRTLVGAPRGHVDAIPCGVDDAWFTSEAGDGAPVDEPYFIFVGNLKPHKNVGLILEAMLGREDSGARLVVVGRVDGMRTVDRSVAEPLERLGKRVVMTGEISDTELHRYVRHAAALVLPSRYEGFGLPPLEAMASGTPALVSRAASLPEVCGDAALYFDADDSTDLTRAMNAVLHDGQLRTDLAVKGRSRARQFQWGHTAERARRMLREAVAA